MSQSSFILKLQKAFVEKLLPEILEVKKDLHVKRFYFTKLIYIEGNNQFKKIQKRIHFDDTYHTVNINVENILKSTYEIRKDYKALLFSTSEEFIDFCESSAKELERLENKKKSVLKIINMSVTYKKELLTEKIK